MTQWTTQSTGRNNTWNCSKFAHNMAQWELEPDEYFSVAKVSILYQSGIKACSKKILSVIAHQTPTSIS